MSSLRRTAVKATLLFGSACGDAARESDAEADCSGPPVFGAAVVVARGPAFVLPGDQTVVVVRAGDGATTPVTTAIAHCSSPDGKPASREHSTTLPGLLTGVRSSQPENAAAVLFMTIADEGDPSLSTILRITFDCASGFGSPQTVVGPDLGVHLSALLGIGPATALGISRSGAVARTSLFIVDSSGVRESELGPSGGVVMARNDSELAVGLASGDDSLFAVYDLTGSRKAGPFSPFSSRPDPSAIAWDGEAWAVAGGTAGEVLYGRLDGLGGWQLQPTRISDGTGHAFDPSLACTPSECTAVWMQQTGAEVSVSDLAQTTIRAVSVDREGGPLSGPVDLEPPADVLAMLPQIWAGQRPVVAWTTYGPMGYEGRLAFGDRCGSE